MNAVVIMEKLESYKESLLGLRLKELYHRSVYGRKYGKMAKATERFAASKDRKPRKRIRREVGLCHRFWKCYPLHYFRYNLYRSDRQLTDADLIDFIPEFFFYQLFLPHHNSRKYKVLLENKAINEQVFRSLGIAQPPTLAKLIGARLWSASMEPVILREMAEALARQGSPKVFVKPLEGMGGYGIHVFHRRKDGRYLTADGGVLDEPFLARIGLEKDYILQPGLEQDRQLAEIYSHSINTFRILTRNLGGEVRLLLATLRIGRAGREVDNSAQDNIILPVDAATGETGASACSEMGECFESHPDSGWFFQGTRIQRWQEVREFAIAAAQKMPQFTFLGWDIALTPDGPVAIETNHNFGLDHYQSVLGGVRQILGIEDPMFYWRNRGRRQEGRRDP